MIPTTDKVFGVHEYQRPDAQADDQPYQVSRTGLVVVIAGHPTHHVLSFINGSMCLNLMEHPVDAGQFEEYAVETFLTNIYEIVGVAYWNPAKGCYTAISAESDCVEMDCLLRDGITAHDYGDPQCVYVRLPDAPDGTIQVEPKPIKGVIGADKS